MRRRSRYIDEDHRPLRRNFRENYHRDGTASLQNYAQNVMYDKQFDIRTLDDLIKIVELEFGRKATRKFANIIKDIWDQALWT